MSPLWVGFPRRSLGCSFRSPTAYPSALWPGARTDRYWVQAYHFHCGSPRLPSPVYWIYWWGSAAVPAFGWVILWAWCSRLLSVYSSTPSSPPSAASLPPRCTALHSMRLADCHHRWSLAYSYSSPSPTRAFPVQGCYLLATVCSGCPTRFWATAETLQLCVVCLAHFAASVILWSRAPSANAIAFGEHGPIRFDRAILWPSPYPARQFLNLEWQSASSGCDSNFLRVQ